MNNKTNFKFFFLPIILLFITIAIIYFPINLNIKFVHVYPMYLSIVILILFGYGILPAIIVNILVSLLGLSSMIFIEGFEKIIIFVELLYIWTFFLVLAKYEKSKKSLKPREIFAFEKINESRNIEEIQYNKERQFLEGLTDKLYKYYVLSNLVNSFIANLNLKDVFELIKVKTKGILKNSEAKIININEINCFTEWVKRHRIPLLVENIEYDYRFSDQVIKETDMKSIMVIPLWNDKELHSFIEISSKKSAEYREDDLRIISSLADNASLAITNSNLFKKVQELVITDSLTKIFNRRYFKEIAKEEFDRAKRYNNSLSILMMDVDYFKQYNDQFGHLEGDKILRTVSWIFKQNLRKTDILARYGGEEFVILMPMIPLENAYYRAENIRKLIESFCGITISIGISSIENAENLEELISLADIALYKAKDMGRNRVISNDKLNEL